MKTYIASFIISVAALFTFSPNKKETVDIKKEPVPRMLTTEEILECDPLNDTVKRLSFVQDSLYNDLKNDYAKTCKRPPKDTYRKIQP